MVSVVVLFTLAACSSGDSSSDSGTDVSTTVPGAVSGPTTIPLDTPTTFILDCAGMPGPTDIATIVGIPIADGAVVGAGTCQFLGLNDQSRVVTLTLLTDPTDQATFNDLVLSLGEGTPLDDPALAGATVDPTSQLYINANGSIYAVRVLVTDGGPAEQVALAAAILRLWLGV